MVKSYKGFGVFKVNGVYICMGIHTKEIKVIGSIEKCNEYLESLREV